MLGTSYVQSDKVLQLIDGNNVLLTNLMFYLLFFCSVKYILITSVLGSQTKDQHNVTCYKLRVI